jgi:hypothetical protein
VDWSLWLVDSFTVLGWTVPAAAARLRSLQYEDDERDFAPSDIAAPSVELCYECIGGKALGMVQRLRVSKWVS